MKATKQTCRLAADAIARVSEGTESREDRRLIVDFMTAAFEALPDESGTASKKDPFANPVLGHWACCTGCNGNGTVKDRVKCPTCEGRGVCLTRD